MLITLHINRNNSNVGILNVCTEVCTLKTWENSYIVYTVLWCFRNMTSVLSCPQRFDSPLPMPAQGMACCSFSTAMQGEDNRSESLLNADRVKPCLCKSRKARESPRIWRAYGGLCQDISSLDVHRHIWTLGGYLSSFLVDLGTGDGKKPKRKKTLEFPSLKTTKSEQMALPRMLRRGKPRDMARKIHCNQ